MTPNGAFATGLLKTIADLSETDPNLWGENFFTVTCKPDMIIYHELQTHSGILILIPNPFSPRPGENP